MSNVQSKYLWPLVGIVIFIVLIAFYIDDRRKLSLEEPGEVASEHDMDSADSGTSAPDEAVPEQVTGDAGHAGSIDDLGTDTSSKRHVDLTRKAEEHKGFSGSIEHYLRARESHQDSMHESSSMSIDEYLGSTEN